MDVQELELPEIIELSELGWLLIDDENPEGVLIDWNKIEDQED